MDISSCTEKPKHLRQRRKLKFNSQIQYKEQYKTIGKMISEDIRNNNIKLIEFAIQSQKCLGRALSK